jgi:hypothetical protein
MGKRHRKRSNDGDTDLHRLLLLLLVLLLLLLFHHHLFVLLAVFELLASQANTERIATEKQQWQTWRG